MGFPYTEVSPVLRSLQSSPVSVPLYNNLWLTSLSPCVCVCVCVSGFSSARMGLWFCLRSFYELSVGWDFARVLWVVLALRILDRVAV